MPRLSPRLLSVLLVATAAGCQDPAGPPAVDDPLRPAATRVVDIALSFQSTCALAADGQLHCWGENRSGEFGNGTRTGSTGAVPGAEGLRLASVHGSMGTSQMCGLTADGTAYCWGYNLNGELGRGYQGDQEVPRPVAGDIRFAALSSAYNTCGVAVGGRAYCWGFGGGGQLGTGSTASSTVPVPVASETVYRAITTGMQFSCALREDGRADCWGWGAGLGSGPSDRSVEQPVPVDGGLRFRDISAGEEHVCAVTLEGAAYCWGMVGDDYPGGFRAAPTAIPGGQRFVSVASASRIFANGTACGLTADGKAYCWHGGREPRAVPGNLRFAGLTGGHGRVCGHTPGGAAFCWQWSAGSGDGGRVPTEPAPIPALPAGS